MKMTIIESPFGKRLDGTACSPEEIQFNLRYARAAMLDSLGRDENPFGSHLLYPQVLNDATPEERKMGMEAGFAWAKVLYVANKLSFKMVTGICAVYEDFGVTEGMYAGIARHGEGGLNIEYRKLGPNWESSLR